MISDSSSQTETPLKRPDFSPNSSTGSPRLKAFEGRAWIRSPRTGYTYVDSATYRNVWTPEREIPMPHMARLPLDAYNDGEVSFRTAIRRRLFEDEMQQQVSKKFSSKLQSIVSTFAKYFMRFLTFILFPFILIGRFSKDCFTTVKNFFRALISTILRNWNAAKEEYKSFMSTSHESTAMSTEDLFTDDECEETVTSTNQRRQERSKVSMFKRIFIYVMSIFSAAPPIDATESSDVESSWIEEFIIRRTSRIFKVFTDTIFRRTADTEVPVDFATGPVHAPLPLENDNKASAPNNIDPPLQDQIETKQKRVLHNEIVENSHQQKQAWSLFRPLAWFVSYWPRLPSSHKRRLSGHERVPTRSSLRLRGIPAEELGLRGSARRAEEEALGEIYEVETRDSYLLKILKDILRYLESDEEMEEDEMAPDDEEVRTSHTLNVYQQFLHLFKKFFSLIFSPLKLLPSLPPRKRSRREKQFRAGSRFSRRLKGMPAENSGYTKSRRCHRVRKELDSELLFSDDEDENFCEEESFHIESFTQRCLDSILDFLGYFQYDQNEGDIDNEEVELADNETGSQSLLKLCLMPITLLATSVSSVFSLPSRDFQWQRSSSGKYFRVGTRHSLRLRGLPPEQFPEPGPSARRPKQKRVVVPNEEDRIEPVGWFQLWFYSFLNWFGYFKNLEPVSPEHLEGEMVSSQWSLILAPLLWPLGLLRNFLTDFSLPPKDLQLLKTKEGKVIRVGGRRSLRLRGLEPEFHGEVPKSPRRRKKSGIARDEIQPSLPQEEEDEVLSTVRYVYIQVLNWFGYFESLDVALEAEASSLFPAGNRAEEDQRNEAEVTDRARFRRTSYAASSGSRVSNQSKCESETVREDDSFWSKVLLCLYTVMSWPFVTVWGAFKSAKNYLRSNEERNSQLKSNTESSRRADPDSRASGNYFKNFFTSQASTDGSVECSAKPYIEIPNYSFIEDEMQLETNGRGRFVSQKLTESHVAEGRRDRRCLLCVVPLLFVLLPVILLLFTCLLSPEIAKDTKVCDQLAETSSHFYKESHLVFSEMGDSISTLTTDLQERMNSFTVQTNDVIGSTIETAYNHVAEYLAVSKAAVRSSVSSWYEYLSVTTESFMNRSAQNLTEHESSITKVSKLVSSVTYSSLLAVYELGVFLFTGFLHICSWIWSIIWFVSIRAWLLIASFGNFFSTSRMDQQAIDSDLIVTSILENPSFKDYLGSQLEENFQKEETSLMERLEEIFQSFVAKLESERAFFDSTMEIREKEMNDLKSEFLSQLDLLMKDQKEMGDRMALLHDLPDYSSKIGHLMGEFKSLRDELSNFKSVDDSELESRLKDLQSKIEKLESDISDLRLQAKNCCRNETFIRDTVTAHLEKWLENDTSRWNDSAYVLRDNLESVLQGYADDMRRDIMATTTEAMRHLAAGETEKTVEHILSDIVGKISSKNLTQMFENSSNTLVRNEIEQMVRNALVVYDADKTGLFDFALETAGGAVVSTRCTESYVTTGASYTLFGIPIWWKSNNPRAAIQPGVLPGECWAFKGSQGHLVIQLSFPMRPTRFSLEHTPKSMSPDGKIDSAPKDFEVFGFEISELDPDPTNLGRFTYDDNGDSIQFFYVDEKIDKVFKFVELHILSNYGNMNYTCLYRFRVHGTR